MPINVRMPDGTVLTNVPDDITQSEVLSRYNAYLAQQDRDPIVVEPEEETSVLDRAPVAARQAQTEEPQDGLGYLTANRATLPPRQDPGALADIVNYMGSTTGAQTAGFGEMLTDLPRVARSMLADPGGIISALGGPAAEALARLGVESAYEAVAPNADEEWRASVAPVANPLIEAGRRTQQLYTPFTGSPSEEYSAAREAGEGVPYALWRGTRSALIGATGSVPTIAAGALAGRFGGPRAAAAVMGVPSTSAAYAGIRETQEREGIDDPGRAFTAALASGLLDATTGLGGRTVATATREALRKGVERGLSGVLREVGKTGLSESGTEVVQNVIEQLGGGQDPFTEESLLQSLDAGLTGFAGGVVLGTPIEGLNRRNDANLRRAFGEQPKLQTIDVNVPGDGGRSVPTTLDILSVPDANGNVMVRTADGTPYVDTLANIEALRPAPAQGETRLDLTEALNEAAMQNADDAALASAVNVLMGDPTDGSARALLRARLRNHGIPDNIADQIVDQTLANAAVNAQAAGPEAAVTAAANSINRAATGKNKAVKAAQEQAAAEAKVEAPKVRQARKKQVAAGDTTPLTPTQFKSLALSESTTRYSGKNKATVAARNAFYNGAMGTTPDAFHIGRTTKTKMTKAEVEAFNAGRAYGAEQKQSVAATELTLKRPLPPATFAPEQGAPATEGEPSALEAGLGRLTQPPQADQDVGAELGGAEPGVPSAGRKQRGKRAAAAPAGAGPVGVDTTGGTAGVPVRGKQQGEPAVNRQEQAVVAAKEAVAVAADEQLGAEPAAAGLSPGEASGLESGFANYLAEDQGRPVEGAAALTEGNRAEKKLYAELQAARKRGEISDEEMATALNTLRPPINRKGEFDKKAFEALPADEKAAWSKALTAQLAVDEQATTVSKTNKTVLGQPNPAYEDAEAELAKRQRVLDDAQRNLVNIARDELKGRATERADAQVAIRDLLKDPNLTDEQRRDLQVQLRENKVDRKYRRKGEGAGLDVGAVKAHIAKIISGWRAAVDVQVVGSLDELPADVREAVIADGAQGAQGLVAPDGTIYIFAENLDTLEDATATVYHEALGHMGLSALLGKRLDSVLQSILGSNKTLREEAEQWMRDNPGAYQGDNALIRALEEVLVERSENGRLQASIWSKIVGVFKDFGRRIGMKLAYTDGEVQTLLARAHDMIVDGPQTSAVMDGLRYMVFGGDRIRVPAEAAKTFLKELGLFTNRELIEMPGEEATQRAARLGIDEEWMDYFSSRKLAARAPEGSEPIILPQPDMSKYMPDVPTKYSRAVSGGPGGNVTSLGKRRAAKVLSKIEALLSGQIKMRPDGIGDLTDDLEDLLRAGAIDDATFDELEPKLYEAERAARDRVTPPNDNRPETPLEKAGREFEAANDRFNTFFYNPDDTRADADRRTTARKEYERELDILEADREAKRAVYDAAWEAERGGNKYSRKKPTPTPAAAKKTKAKTAAEKAAEAEAKAQAKTRRGVDKVERSLEAGGLRNPDAVGAGLNEASEGASEFFRSLVDQAAEPFIDLLDFAQKNLLVSSALRTSLRRGSPATATIAEQIQEVLARMQAMQRSMAKAMGGIGKGLQTFLRSNKDANYRLAKTMHLARVLRHNPTLYKDRASALAEDRLIVAKRAESAKLKAKKDADEKAKIEATIKQREADINATWDAYEALGKLQGGHYQFRKQLQFFKDMHTALLAALDSNLEMLNIPPETKEQLKKLRDPDPDEVTDADDDYPGVKASLLDEVYFPFSRFGDFVMVAKWKGKNGRRARWHYDTRAERAKFERRFKRDYAKDIADGRVTYEFMNAADAQALDMQESTLLRDIFNAIEKTAPKGSTEEEYNAFKKQAKDRIYQVYLLSLPERSLRKQFVHAKLIEGQSPDVGRVFADAASRYASQLPKFIARPKIDRLISEGKKSLEGLQDTDPGKKEDLLSTFTILANRAEEEFANQEISGVAKFINLTAFGHLMTGALSTFVQTVAFPQQSLPRMLIQYPTIAPTVISAYLKVLGELPRLVIEVDPTTGERTIGMPSFGNTKFIQNNKARQKLFRELESRGFFFQHQTDMVLRGMSGPQPGITGMAGNLYEDTIRAMGVPMTSMDQLVREMTAMMFAEMEYKKTKNFDAAISAAIRNTDDTLGDYSDYEQPGVFRGGIGRFLRFLRTYSVQRAKYFGRMILDVGRGSPYQNRLQTITELLTVGFVTTLFGGVASNFGYSLLTTLAEALFSAMMDDDEEDEFRRENPASFGPSIRSKITGTEFNADHYLRFKIIPELFGVDSGTTRSLQKGLASHLLNIDLSGRVSQNDLFVRDWRSGDDAVQTAFNFIEANLAPQISSGAGFIRGFEALVEGDWQRAIKGLTPAAFRGSLLAREYAEEGIMPKTASPEPVFTPEEVTRGVAPPRPGTDDPLRGITREETRGLVEGLTAVALGGQPLDVALVYERDINPLFEVRNAYENRKTAILERVRREFFRPNPDPEQFAKLREDIDAYNRTVPVDLRMSHVIDEARIADSIEASLRQPRFRGYTVEKDEAILMLRDRGLVTDDEADALTALLAQDRARRQ